jgi:hypothetical protein
VSTLLPWVTRDDEQDTIESELFARFQGGHEMSDVDRIEGPAEDPESFRLRHRGSLQTRSFDGFVNGA